MYFDKVTLWLPRGQGRRNAEIDRSNIMVYVRRRLAVPLRTAGRDRKVRAGVYFEGEPHRPAGGRSGWGSWGERERC